MVMEDFKVRYLEGQVYRVSFRSVCGKWSKALGDETSC